MSSAMGKAASKAGSAAAKTAKPKTEAAPAAAPAAPGAPAGLPSVAGGGGSTGAHDVVSLGNQYKSEFEQTFEGLKQRAMGMQATVQEKVTSAQSTLEPIKNDMISSVADTASAVTTPPGAIVNAFMWITVMTFGAGVGFLLGANIFGPILASFVGGLAFVLIALVGLPYYIYGQLGQADDLSTRMTLLSWAFAAGIFLGTAQRATYFYAEPIMFLTPLIISLAFSFGAPALGTARVPLLGASIGGAVFAMLLTGLISGGLCGGYFLLMLGYAAVAFVTLQMMFKHCTSDDGKTYAYMLFYTVAVLAIKVTFFTLLGSSEPYPKE